MYVVRKEKFNRIKKVASFQQVSNDLSFVEVQGTGEELQTKNVAEVQYENSEQLKNYMECVSDDNRRIEN